MRELLNKTMIVTGASSGLGREVSLLALQEGANVIGISRSESELESLAELARESEGSFLIHVLDVVDPAAVESFFLMLDERFSSIDILVNSAGVGIFGDADELEFSDYEKAIGVNLMGTIYMSHQAFLRMKRQCSGHILNVISSSGTKARVRETAYAASKFGAHGYTLALAEDAKPYNVRVTSFRPGGMNTPFWKMQKDHRSDVSGFMDPKEVALLVIQILRDWQTMVINDIAVNRLK